jgi:formate-dependent nitrite reductase membrane component NrfD
MWSWLRALNFSLIGLGAGLFLVSLWLDFSWGALVGWLLVAVGGNATLVANVGRAERLWLTMLNFRLSWMARGVVAAGVFTIFGFLYWALLQTWLPLAIGSPGYWAIKVVAGLAALFLLILDGLIMNSSPGIPLWHTSLLPILFLFYGLLGGTALTLLMLYYGLGETASSTTVLAWSVVGLLAANIVILLLYMVSIYYGGLASRESARLLLKGKYAPYWLGLVIGVGLVVPLSLTTYVIGTQNVVSFVWAAVAILVGNYAARFLLLRSGVYAAVRTIPNS